jgi:hypothetical protein
MDAQDVHGPVDTLVIEFPADADGARTADALRDLIDRGTVRLYDLMAVRVADDGSCSEITLDTDGAHALGTLGSFAGARSGLLTAEDMEDLTGLLEPGTVAVVLVYENAWAIPFVAAARAEGAELVASSRLSAQVIMDALDAVDVTA